MLVFSLTFWLTAAACGPATTVEGEISINAEPQPENELPPAPRTTEGRFRPPQDGACVELSLPAIQAQIFVPRCTSCHGAEDPAEGLDLSLEVSELRARLLEPSAQTPSGMPLVTPGSVGASYLLLKVALADPLRGAQMPKDEAPLEDCEQEALRSWILEDAP